MFRQRQATFYVLNYIELTLFIIRRGKIHLIIIPRIIIYVRNRMNLFQANISALEMTDNQILMFHVSFCDVGIAKGFLPRTTTIASVPSFADP